MDDVEIRDFLTNGMLVFDTNVLLYLYFYTDDTRNKMFGVMEKCKERLWMSYHVGREYFNNRKDMLSSFKLSSYIQ